MSYHLDFDQLAREVAGGLPRREVLRRLVAGLAGTLAAALGLSPTAMAQTGSAGGNSNCAHFCAGVYPPGPGRGACTSAATRGKGLCYQCGPAAPQPHGPVCGVQTAPFCCSGGQTCCQNSDCSDLKSDTANCGACGNICPSRPNSAPTCVNGLCGYRCNTGFADCNAGAADGCETHTDTDVENCGACNHRCPAPANGTATCSSGACGIQCDTGFTDCGGACLNLGSDNHNCGACGHPCGSGESCMSGQCTAACPAGQTACAGACVNLQTDGQNCGACGAACIHSGSNLIFPCCGGACMYLDRNPFLHCCNGTILDGGFDPNNCGGCGTVCPAGQVCFDSVCLPCSTPSPCPIGQLCAAPCPAGLVCAAGSCVSSCPAGQSPCNGQCVDLQTDNQNCGVCGTVCNQSGGSANGQLFPCCGGACLYADVNPTFACCNGTILDTQADPNNCGACGNVCPAGQVCHFECLNCSTTFPCPGNQVCSAGSCVSSCPARQSPCSGQCVDLNTDSQNCGACASVCNQSGGSANGQLFPCCGGVCLYADVNPFLRCCNGTALDTSADRNNCGNCGIVCASAQSCVNGLCVP